MKIIIKSSAAWQGLIEHVCQISGSISQKLREDWMLNKFEARSLNQPVCSNGIQARRSSTDAELVFQALTPRETPQPFPDRPPSRREAAKTLKKMEKNKERKTQARKISLLCLLLPPPPPPPPPPLLLLLLLVLLLWMSLPLPLFR